MNTRDVEQKACIQSLREDLAKTNKVLYVAATGMGKSHIATQIANNIKTNILIVTPRVNLVDDLKKRIPEASIYCATLKEKKIGKVTIATKQSIPLEYINQFDVVLFDEVHSYTKEYLDKITASKIIGCTATPWRETGPIYGKGKYFDRPSYSCDIKKAVELGFICDY